MPNNTKWQMDFELEAEKIQKVFGEEMIHIHHIGSTSVPGLKAKPIIDMMPVVRDIEKIDAFAHQMLALGYEPMGEFGLDGRRYFRKGVEKRTHHVHVFQACSPHVTRHLAFQDYLREHTDQATRYGDLKQVLAERYPQNIAAYMDGKDGFIKQLEKVALQWYQKH